MNTLSGTQSHPTHQRGVALVVVLILLLIMTLLGLASLRGTLMEERMSANLYDRSLAFQSAEAAMREAEVRLLLPATQQAFPVKLTVACSNGLCAEPIPADGTLDRWLDPATAWQTATVAVGTPDTPAIAPQYVIEEMAPVPATVGADRLFGGTAGEKQLAARYRITARSSAADRAEVILQSSYSIAPAKDTP